MAFIDEQSFKRSMLKSLSAQLDCTTDYLLFIIEQKQPIEAIRKINATRLQLEADYNALLADMLKGIDG